MRTQAAPEPGQKASARGGAWSDAGAAHPAAQAGSPTVQRLLTLQRLADASAVVQRLGRPPYKREITLLTKYVTLSLRHPTAHSVSDAEAGAYEVQRLTAKDRTRPPVWSDGVQQVGQGQHKVAWGAISMAIERCTGRNLAGATAIMQEIIARSGIAPTGDAAAGNVTSVGDLSTPAAADALLMLAHNYLAGRQMADPSWAAEGEPEQKKAQLKGKGEKAMRDVLGAWQALVAGQPDSAAKAQEVLESDKMRLLFDMTGRSAEERIDVAKRAILELEIQNPVMFRAVAAQARALVAARAGLAPTDF